MLNYKRILAIIVSLSVVLSAVVWSMPKLWAGDAVVNDLTIQSQVVKSNISLTVSDQNPNDKKVVIPIDDDNLIYKNSQNGKAAVTYDRVNHQLVIDWLDGQPKQITINISAKIVKNYQFMASTVRNNDVVTSQIVPVAVRELEQVAVTPQESSTSEPIINPSPKSNEPETKLDSDDLAVGVLGSCPWRLDAAGTLHIQGGEIREDQFDGIYRSPWFSYNDQILNVIVEGPIKVVGNVTSIFSSLPKVKSIKGLNLMDMSQATSLDSMFYEDKSLVTIQGLETWDTSNVKGMGNTFQNCESLTTLDVSKWDFSKCVTTMFMFGRCKRLTTLDVSNWDVSKLFDMTAMFYRCESLKELDLTRWNLDETVEMAYVFDGCGNSYFWDPSGQGLYGEDVPSEPYGVDENPINLKLKGMRVGKKMRSVESMFKMANVDTIDLSTIDTSHVISTESMFFGCQCRDLNIQNINTSNVTQMQDMFGYFNAVWAYLGQPTPERVVKKLDLTNFDTRKVKGTVGYLGPAATKMFEGCQLESLDISSFIFPQDDGETAEMMFTDAKIPSITFGKDTNIASSQNNRVGLSAPYNEKYSGYWESEKYPGQYYQSADLANQYDGRQMAGEWHWQANKEAIKVKDTTITVGDSWQPADNFVSATTKTGETETLNHIRVVGTVNTNQPGIYEVNYINGYRSATAKITVTEGQLAFKNVPQKLTFTPVTLEDDDGGFDEQFYGGALKEKQQLQISDTRSKKGKWRLEVQRSKLTRADGRVFRGDVVIRNTTVLAESAIDITDNNGGIRYDYDLTSNDTRIVPDNLDYSGDYQGKIIWTIVDSPV